MEALKELLPFLEPSARIDVKCVALQHVLGLTGNAEGVALLAQLPEVLNNLVLLTKDSSDAIAKDAALSLINLSASNDVVKILLGLKDIEVVHHLWQLVSDKSCPVSDPVCMIFSNLTIDKQNCDTVWTRLKSAGITLDKLVFIFCQEGYNEKGAKLHYLGPVLSNLSQLSEARQQILDKDAFVIQRLLPFTEYKPSRVRRGGIIGTLKNCCFDTDCHEWLLSDKVDILPRLLLPLAGPTPDDLTEEDIEMLPVDLQYLDEDKTVEEDPDLRKMLLEAINQLCATRQCRETVRLKSTYFILRELHKVEKDKHVKLACENLVDILIKKEEEINVDNYNDVQVPDDVVPQLEEMDRDYLKESNE